MWLKGAKDGEGWSAMQAFTQNGHFLTSNGNGSPTLKGIYYFYSAR